MRVNYPLMGKPININTKMDLILNHHGNPPITYISIGTFTRYEDVKNLLNIPQEKMEEYMEETNGYIDSLGGMAFYKLEDGQKMMDILNPYYIAEKLAGNLDW